MLECAICGAKLKVITHSHLRKHGLTVRIYREQYSDKVVSQEVIDKKLKYSYIDWNTMELGKYPDSEIAARLGIPRKDICVERNRLGIKPFNGYLRTQEGEHCRSVYEAMYDAYLHWKGLEHWHEVDVVELSYIADFLVGNQFIEIVGMGGFERYQERHDEKKLGYESANIDVTWIYPKEVITLYKNCPVLLNADDSRICKRCGLHTYDLVKGFCRDCYMIRWHNENADVYICEQCGDEFKSTNPKARFCNRYCYWESMGLKWPSWEWLALELERKSSKELAIELGIKPTTMYMHLHRRRQRNNGQLLAVG